MGKKGFRISKKGLEKGFLNKRVGESSSSSSSSPSFEAKKQHFISELKRILPIRNECKKAKELSNQSNDPDFMDDKEKEAFNTFQGLMNNAGWDLVADPDVIEVMEQADHELECEIAMIRMKKLSVQGKKAKEEFVEQKGLGKGFLNKRVDKSPSSSSGTSSTCFEAKKQHFISEIRRILSIRNECMKAKELSNQSNALDFMDDKEREAFNTFQGLMNNAGWDLVAGPDVIEVMEQADHELECEIAMIRMKKLSMQGKKAKEEDVEQKGSGIAKKGLEKGFLNKRVGQSSYSSSSSASFEAKKQHFISELKRILPIRNECMKAKESSNQSNDRDFMDDKEKEAFNTFQALMNNAGWDLVEDPDVIEVIEQADDELECKIAMIQMEKLSMQGKKAKDEFVEQKGSGIAKKGLEKGFLNRRADKSPSSSSGTSSTTSFEARKQHLISELKRLLPIRNECRIAKELSNQSNDPDCVDDKEKEASNTFQALMNNAGFDLVADPDVIKLIEEADHELESEIYIIQRDKLLLRVNKAKEEFVSGLIVGREVRVVEGENVGKKGSVVEVRLGDETVKLRFLNGEEVVVFVRDVALLGSTAEDLCLKRLMEGKEVEDVCFRKARGVERKCHGGFGRNI